VKKIFFAPDDMCTMLKLEVKKANDFLVANGWETVTNPEESDLIFCGTCVGFDNLEERSLNRICELKQYNKEMIVYGCLVSFNFADLSNVYQGVSICSWEISKISEFILNAEVSFQEITDPSVFRSKEDYRLYDLSKRFVNIAFGCDCDCSFCPHKVGAGSLRSRPVDDILNQIKRLTQNENGVNTIVIAGLETGRYGIDLGITYPQLFERILAIDAEFSIHVSQFNPSGISEYYDELIPLFSNDRVRDIQIPVETTSRRLLSLMNRPLDTVKVGEFLKKIRSKNSKAVFRTDLLVGFPTETIEELMESLKFVVDAFDEIAVYGLEPKKGVPLEKMGLPFYDKQEVLRRSAFARAYISKAGKLAHSGAQEAPDLLELENRRQELRKAKYNK
jgi:tRNA A37 methylthiotransferase MiaB